MRILGLKLFEKKVKVAPYRSPMERINGREVKAEIDIKGGEKKITLAHLSFLESFEVENQVKAVTRGLEERKNDPGAIVAASRTVRLQMLLFYAVRLDGKQVFSDPLEVADVLTPEQQIGLYKVYAEAFMLSEEERGNWWRDKTQA
jgi:hypothetical protein